MTCINNVFFVSVIEFIIMAKYILVALFERCREVLRKDLGSVLSLFCFDILSTFVLVLEYLYV